MQVDFKLRMFFPLFQCHTFQKEASGTNLIPALVIGARTLDIIYSHY